MEKNKNKIGRFIILLCVILIVFLLFFINVRTMSIISSGYNRLNCQDNGFILQTSIDSFYDVNVNRLSNIYTSEEIKRIKNFNIIYDDIDEYEYAYYNDSKLFPFIFKDKIYKSNFFGSDIYFNISTDSSVFVKETFKLPDVSVENISKIIINGDGKKLILMNLYQKSKKKFFSKIEILILINLMKNLYIMRYMYSIIILIL